MAVARWTPYRFGVSARGVWNSLLRQANTGSILLCLRAGWFMAMVSAESGVGPLVWLWTTSARLCLLHLGAMA